MVNTQLGPRLTKQTLHVQTLGAPPRIRGTDAHNPPMQIAVEVTLHPAPRIERTLHPHDIVNVAQIEQFAETRRTATRPHRERPANLVLQISRNDETSRSVVLHAVHERDVRERVDFGRSSELGIRTEVEDE